MRLWLLPLFCFSVTVQAEPLSISRLQLRMSDVGTYSFTESIYHRFGDGTYLLQIYDNEKAPGTDSDNERLELYLGRPINKRWGWVARAQKWSNSTPISSAGMQLQLDQAPGVAEVLTRMNAASFVQVFLKNREGQLGNWEMLHYYQLKSPLGLPLEIRGNNVYYHRDEGGDLWNFWFDAIHQLHRHWDVYLRWNYLNKADPLLGNAGQTTSLGIRFNL